MIAMGLTFFVVLLFAFAVFIGLAVKRSVPAVQIVSMCVLSLAILVAVPLSIDFITDGRGNPSETTPWAALAAAILPFVWLEWRRRRSAGLRAPDTRATKHRSEREAPANRTATGRSPAAQGTQADATEAADALDEHTGLMPLKPGKRPPRAQATDATPETTPAPTTVFISYRRDDSTHVTGRLYDRLSTEFGREHVYKDVDTIPLGVDFREHINKLVGTCDVVLAVIGERWLTVTDTNNNRRLDDERDPVRLEIVAALNRDIPVVPVLVGGSVIPPAEALPEDIAGLAYRNGTAVRPDPDFHKDVDRLIAGVRAAARHHRSAAG